MHLDNFASCTINFEQKDKERQMSSRYIPAGKTTEQSEKKTIGAHGVKDRFKTCQKKCVPVFALRDISFQRRL